MPVKNTLVATDAEHVEAGFRSKLAAFEDGQPDDGPLEAVQSPPAAQPCTTPGGEKPSAAVVKETSIGGVHPWARPSACATSTTSNLYPSSHASCAAANRQTRITFALPSRARWAARSAMSSQFRFVAFITAKFTGTVTRRPGGKESILIPWRLRSPFGKAHTVTGWDNRRPAGPLPDERRSRSPPQRSSSEASSEIPRLHSTNQGRRRAGGH
jgi:hypothetical protein